MVCVVIPQENVHNKNRRLKYRRMFSYSQNENVRRSLRINFQREVFSFHNNTQKYLEYLCMHGITK